MKRPVPPLVISTDQLPERERFDAWRETFALKLARVDVTTPDRAIFRAIIGIQPLERVSVITNDVCPVGLLRTPELVRDGDDDVTLMIGVAGTCEARFDDWSVMITPGAATLVPHDRLGGVFTGTGAKTLSLRLPRSLLREILGSAEPPIGRLIAGSEPALQLISAYARGLATGELALSAPTAAIAGRQLAELIAHLLAPATDIVRAEEFGGVKAARLHTIIMAIDQHFADPNLNAAGLGARIGLSARYVHHLLAGAGVTFSQLLRQRRLEEARRMLENRTAPPRRIVDIAYAVGFSDLSHFNHAFRRHFGRTPSDVRRG